MGWTKIDRPAWKREEYFRHYHDDVPCFYSMTVSLDVTRLRAAGLKLYPAMLYILSTIVNRHEELRTAMVDGAVGVYDALSPCYTVFHPETETFSNLWTEYSEDYQVFCQRYRQDWVRYGDVHAFNAKAGAPVNVFPISMIPWEHFDGFHLHLQKGYEYLLPIFTMGKYVEAGGRSELPIAVQVHHAVCHGFHLCRFLEELRESLESAAL